MAEAITDILAAYFRENGMEKTLMERHVLQAWPAVVGKQAAQLSGNMEVRDGVMYVHIHSAALRAQLFECRFELVKKLNEKVGGNILRDIRLLG